MKLKIAISTLLVLIFLCICFIWGNSTLNGTESSQISGGLLNWLVSHFSFLGWTTEIMLRKLGHFTEFAGTGFLLAWFCHLKKETGIHRFSSPLLCAMLIATADETIQKYVPLRESAVLDVWIDTFGAATGITIFLAGYAVWKKHRAGK